MNTFFTSDWHIGHANSLIFDKRPFKDLDHMHEVLINNFNSTVKVGDVTYFLGDVGLAKSDTIRKVITRLVGIKVCVLGNHDGGPGAMYKNGFDVVLNRADIYIGDKRVSMSHCPMKGIFREKVDIDQAHKGTNWHGEDRNHRFTVRDEGQYHLHGHIHSREGNDKSKRVLGRQMDIGVVANNYRPVHIKVIESFIALHQKETQK